MEAEQKYPLNREGVTENDLRYLAKALGFQAKVFLSAEVVKTSAEGPPRTFWAVTDGGGVSEELFIHLLDSRVFDRRLHKTFNTRDADYNVKLTKGALGLLVRKMCSYQEIRQIRLAFQIYECEDGMGMSATVPTVLQALHMCGRIASPLKLGDFLKGQQVSFDVPTRLQLYEFLDLVVFNSQCLEEVERQIRAKAGSPLKGNSMLISAGDALLTRPQQAERYLDAWYHELLFPKVDTVDSNVARDSFVNTRSRRGVVAWGRCEATRLLPPLLSSSAKLHQSRAGSRLRSCDGLTYQQTIAAKPSTHSAAAITGPSTLSAIGEKGLQSVSMRSWQSVPPSFAPCFTATQLEPLPNAPSLVPPLGEHLYQDSERNEKDSSFRRPFAITSLHQDQHQNLIDDLKWRMLRQETHWLRGRH